MTCYVIRNETGERICIACGTLGDPCVCGSISDILCDFPVAEGKTCDARLCNHCGQEVAPDIHYCPGHFAVWNEFKAAGGVQTVLRNIWPFRSPASGI